ncbi:MAG: hypothetical protein ACKVLN_12585, partial [Rhodobacterales bacterium]
RGTIPENRQDSQKVAQRIAADIAGLGTDINKSGQAALYSRFGKKIVTYRDWLAIDSAEQAAAPEGRCRMKLKTVEDMLHVVNERRTME